MPILSDCHLHTHHSGDSQTPMEDTILQGIRQGLATLCFTEHNDFDFPDAPDEPGSVFLLNADSYRYEFNRLQEKYAGKIQLLFGAELGLQPHIAKQNADFAKSYDFDFLIGSSHLCHGKDPYYPDFFAGKSEAAAYLEYFESILENLQVFSDFDVYGHLDYIVRYGPHKDRDYCYENYKEILDAILKKLIENGKGIEINTGGFQSGLRELHPCTAAVRRYRELGGEIITIGSDSHDTAHIAAHFDLAEAVLSECGFRYYTVFEKRSPKFRKL